MPNSADESTYASYNAANPYLLLIVLLAKDAAAFFFFFSAIKQGGWEGNDLDFHGICARAVFSSCIPYRQLIPTRPI